MKRVPLSTRCIRLKREFSPFAALAYCPYFALKPREHDANDRSRGHFSDFCDKCVLIKPGQSDRQVGYILCSCGPKGSEIRLEYTYDLSESSLPGFCGIALTDKRFLDYSPNRHCH